MLPTDECSRHHKGQSGGNSALRTAESSPSQGERSGVPDEGLARSAYSGSCAVRCEGDTVARSFARAEVVAYDEDLLLMGECRTNQPIALGVLFVHGIGAQRRGETLAQFGEPLFRWLDEWARGIRLRWIRHGLSQEAIRVWRDAHRPEDTTSPLTRAF